MFGGKYPGPPMGYLGSAIWFASVTAVIIAPLFL